jgi:hypothetical protein
MTATAAATIPAAPDRSLVATWVALFITGTVLFGKAFSSFLELHGSSDLTSHITYAQRIGALSDITTPHFLFELLIKAGAAVGFGEQAVAVWLLGACYGGMAVLIGYEIHRRGIVTTPLRAFASVTAVLLASHIFLLSIGSHLYQGFFVPTAYHSPTQQLNKLLALVIYFVYCRQFLGGARASWSSVPVLAVLCVLSAIAKPSFLIAFLPAAALYAAYDLFRFRWHQALLCLVGIGIPSALTSIWQTRQIGTAGDPISVAFMPFVVFNANETMYKLPLSLAFPLVVAAGAVWTRTADARLRFIWTFTAVALFVTLCLVEAGKRMMHGNFAWTGQTAVFLVYVESMLFLLSQPPRIWTRVAWVVFGVHVVSGVLWYSTAFIKGSQSWL